MNVLQKVYYLFSQYTDPFERKIGKFFAKLNEDDQKSYISSTLLGLMQKDLVKINLLSEAKYKGYKYLKKSTRRRLYINSQLICDDFKQFNEKYQYNESKVTDEIRATGANIAGVIPYPEKLAYISAIMNYLSPNAGTYSYRESSTFGELLKNPADKDLQGDCNQIVTLYIYLYSVKYDISDLQIKTYPGHVALHFHGVDVEATNGTFQNYNHEEQRVLPIQEIVSVNLLDVTDKYFSTHSIDPESQLQSARLALLVSSNQQMVQQNLTATYNNAVASMMGQNNYTAALKYARQSKNLMLIQLVGHNGAVKLLNEKQYKLAEKFAQFASDKTDLLKTIYYNHAVDLYNSEDYLDAIKQFQKSGGHQDIINKCYVGLYMNEQRKLGSMSTKQDVQNNKSIINNMYHYAKLSGDSKIIEHVKSLMKYL